MELIKKDVDDDKVRDSQDGLVFLKEGQPSSSSRNFLGISPLKKTFEGKDALSYANILRSRNKFVDAFAVYESVLEKDGGNVEALIGKGICLQMQNLGRLAYETFAEAVRLQPQNACALTHSGILYKDEGRLVEAAEVCLHTFIIDLFRLFLKLVDPIIFFSKKKYLFTAQLRSRKIFIIYDFLFFILFFFFWGWGGGLVWIPILAG